MRIGKRGVPLAGHVAPARGTMRLALFILILLLPVAIHAADLSGSIDDVAAGIATYFPKATGTVVGVSVDAISIDIKDGFGLSEGVLLSVFREGSSFNHPVTGVPLGHFEEEVGWVEVIQFNPQQVIARPISSQMSVVQGDWVRLTKGRIPVAAATARGPLPLVAVGATAPVDFSTPASGGLDPLLLREFILALEGTGRFSATVLSPHATLEEAAALGNLYVITFDNAKTGGGAIGTRVQNTKTGKVIAKFETTLQGSNDSDFIVESFQQRLFEKYQSGIIK